MSHVLDAAMEDAIYEWASFILGPDYQVIWAYANAAGSALGQRPSKSICELRIPWIRDSTGRVDESWVATDTYDYSQVIAFTLRINIFTNDAHMAAAQKLRRSLMLPTVLEKLRAAGLAVWKRGEPNDLSAAEGGKYELRAQMEFEFSYIQVVQDAPGEFQDVQAEFFADGQLVAEIDTTKPTQE